MQTIKANRDTHLKRTTSQSIYLKDSDKISIKKGTEIRCTILSQDGDHHQIQLAQPQIGFFNWFIFIPHWQIKTISAIDWSNPSSKVSEFFTVAEVIQNDDRRIPTDPVIQKNILALATELDQIRKIWNAPIGITSWYRPPAINAAVGGVPNSQHIFGSAADIYPIGSDGIEFENWLDNYWGDKALGYGQAAGRGFTHIDLRPGNIRWDY